MAFNRITRSALFQLIDQHGGPHVTLYLAPPSRVHDSAQDSTRITNLARQAHAALVSYWMKESDATTMLQPLTVLSSSADVSKPRSHGLAIYLDEHGVKCFRVESSVREQLFIARRFLIRPMLASLERLDRYEVLTLSENRVALYAGTPEGLTGADIGGLPPSFRQWQETLTADRGSQVHSAHAHVTGKQGAVFHGQGGTADTEAAGLDRYFRQIDQVIGSHRAQQPDSPLILAGEHRVTSLFRSISKDSSLVRSAVDGNVDRLSKEQLHDRVKDIVRGEWERRRNAQAERIREHDVPTTTDPERILVAACGGEVDTLFIDQDEELYGMFMADRGILKELRRAPVGDPADTSHDLMELAAVETLVNGGHVHSVKSDQMPVKSAMAAALRFVP
ncbi:MAG: hypothetical protein AAGA03_02670 [Planctomycetota bacterium]